MQSKVGKEKMGKAILMALSFGVLVHLAFFAVLHLELPTFQYEPKGSTNLSYVGSENKEDLLLREQTLLYDSAPLFMPTRWSGASRFDNIATLKQATEAFLPFKEVVSLGEARVSAVDLVNDSRPIASAFLPDGPAFELSEFGRNKSASSGKNRLGGAELIVASLSGSQRVIHFPLPAEIISYRPQGLWEPIEWAIHLEQSKLLGPPQIIKGSSFPDWDELVMEYVQRVEVYSQFPNGYLKILVSP